MTSIAELAGIEALGVFTDIDGTLSPIAPTPDAAIVLPECQAVLRELTELVPLVAAVSGRAPADAYRMVGVDGMMYVGNHGLERWVDGAVSPVPEVVPYAQAIARVMQALERHTLPEGVLLENKGVTASIHYRQAPDPQTAGVQLESLLRPLCDQQGLRLMPGRMIFEVRPPLDVHKGTAIQTLIDEYKLQAAVFLGDDVTDVDGFRALHAARNAGLVTLTVGVESPETPSQIRDNSDQLVTGVHGVVEWLEQLVTARRAAV